MIQYRADTIRQKPPASKAPEPEPIQVAHPTQMSKSKGDMSERDAQIKRLFEAGKGASEIASELGYTNASGVSKRLLVMGLRTKGYRGRPR